MRIGTATLSRDCLSRDWVSKDPCLSLEYTLSKIVSWYIYYIHIKSL
jgi:hypothetical protein